MFGFVCVISVCVFQFLVVVVKAIAAELPVDPTRSTIRVLGANCRYLLLKQVNLIMNACHLF